MKIKLFLLALSGIISVTASAQKESAESPVDNTPVTQYANAVIDMGNTYAQIYNSYTLMLATSDCYLKGLNENSDLKPITFNCNVQSEDQQREQQSAYDEALRSVQSSPEIDEIDADVEIANNLMKFIGDWCADLSNYFDNHQYKIDKQQKEYTIIRDSLVFYLNEASSSWENACLKASLAIYRSELVQKVTTTEDSQTIPMNEQEVISGDTSAITNDHDQDFSVIETSHTVISE